MSSDYDEYLALLAEKNKYWNILITNSYSRILKRLREKNVEQVSLLWRTSFDYQRFKTKRKSMDFLCILMEPTTPPEGWFWWSGALPQLA